MIQVIKSTRRIAGSCNACDAMDAPAEVVYEIILRDGNSITFRLCRKHAKEIRSKLNVAAML